MQVAGRVSVHVLRLLEGLSRSSKFPMLSEVSMLASTCHFFLLRLER
eukprot:CAMPEP_0204021898 /NCGR_PEP_ID=MMETSP0360-20130528/30403_1 /ASSEMBLY_ACC=CAM_ASM_000342 /TAXON_ID=268821 /ORGANISM="Scrippsiella Hangoei, Strain SHTV-5" /LENGTH=46 /DNA_ID= /DNA_START= /DNA_END= /DNA_ORIENTATION=